MNRRAPAALATVDQRVNEIFLDNLARWAPKAPLRNDVSRALRPAGVEVE